jgi:hypothetical protein
MKPTDRPETHNNALSLKASASPFHWWNIRHWKERMKSRSLPEGQAPAPPITSSYVFPPQAHAGGPNGAPARRDNTLNHVLLGVAPQTLELTREQAIKNQERLERSTEALRRVEKAARIHPSSIPLDIDEQHQRLRAMIDAHFPPQATHEVPDRPERATACVETPEFARRLVAMDRAKGQSSHPFWRRLATIPSD